MNRKNISLEKNLKRIREIADQVQSEQTDLDKALEHYKEAMELIKVSREYLDSAQFEFKKLQDEHS
jgi:exodeoxyribonuclease VII small subunit